MLPDFTDHIRIEPWPDPVIDQVGHDPRSIYVEWFWLSVLGPSTIWLLRRLVAALDHQPDGFDLDVSECAAALGLQTNAGRNAIFLRTLHRACQFHLARRIDASTLQVRRHIPPLTRGQVLRLPPSLRDAHDRWLADELAQHRAERDAAAFVANDVA
ncbi:MAG TPA: hypothetical protein VGQ20_09205 [Acidimicrobiales bacterium]|nr:hypothetical protein [Acidimicrobiales bacterium]